MPALQDNLNRITALLAPERERHEGADLVFRALADRSVAWPPPALAALNIPNLHENALAMLVDVARCVIGGQSPNGWLRNLRNRVERYHNIKV